jgi:hypothetical protein
MLHGVFRNEFVQNADLVDAVHDSPHLCNRRSGQSVGFVEGLQPLLNFKD